MNRDQLRAVQAPLKERYRAEPEAGLITLKAEGRIGEHITCSIQTGKALVEAGLHPATGGPGTFACSGDMLLEALAACAGVTMAAVATSLGVELRGGTVRLLRAPIRWRQPMVYQGNGWAVRLSSEQDAAALGRMLTSHAFSQADVA